MTIFLYVRSEKKWRSHRGGRCCFDSDRRWSQRRQTLALRLSAYPRRGQQRRRRRTPGRSRNRRWHQRLSLSVQRPGEHASIRRYAVSIDRPTDTSVAAERGAGAFWTDRRWSGLTSDASNAGSQPLDFKCTRHVAAI
jgi:hypothetical protein